MQMVNQAPLRPIAAIQDASLAGPGIVVCGELYLSGLPEKGRITRYHRGEKTPLTKCIFNYSLSTPESESG